MKSRSYFVLDLSKLLYHNFTSCIRVILFIFGFFLLLFLCSLYFVYRYQVIRVSREACAVSVMSYMRVVKSVMCRLYISVANDMILSALCDIAFFAIWRLFLFYVGVSAGFIVFFVRYYCAACLTRSIVQSACRYTHFNSHFWLLLISSS